jgi:Zn-dependent peptidase ImmA (M78 family)
MKSSGNTEADFLLSLENAVDGVFFADFLVMRFSRATIRYRSLSGCAARIMGYNNRAIITIDDHTPRPRQRFSAGHELGHWMRDRGLVSFQCTNATFVQEWSAENPETRANRFASDLLLPPKMFRPRSRGLPVTFESVRQLAGMFTTSLTATAIRAWPRHITEDRRVQMPEHTFC